VWELWDVGTGNIINTYPTEQAALALVRRALDRHGRHYLANWALGRAADDDEPDSVIEGDALVDRAIASLSQSG
jgi:hypothetical protein